MLDENSADNNCTMCNFFMATSIPREHTEISLIPQSGFLRLPVHIREEIYACLGLIRRCPINIEEESSRWRKLRAAHDRSTHSDVRAEWDESMIPIPRMEVWRFRDCVYDQKHGNIGAFPAGLGCVHRRLPVHLSLVSKQIHAEVQQVLYSRNTIVLGSTMRGLPVLAVAVLTSLEIQLTTCSCVNDHECQNLNEYEEFNDCCACHFGCKRGKGMPLSLNQPQSQVILDKFRSLCTVLRQNCSKDLELTVICDCVDISTAREVVKHLQDFPRLRHAAVRLSQSCNEALQSLAEQTVRRLTGTDNQRFPFQKLPLEIQQLVLDHTHLVASAPVSWNQAFCHNGIYGGDTPLGNQAWGFRLLHDRQLACCLRCTSASQVCACPTRHSGYSSHICDCWHLPKPLFLVNKWFHEQSIKIFFSRNRFVFWDSSHPGRRIDRSMSSSHYLVRPLRTIIQMPLRWQESMRWLSFRFMRFRSPDCLQKTLAYDRWAQLSSILKKWPTLPQLTIELDFAHDQEHQPAIHIPDENKQEAVQSWRNIAKLFEIEDGNLRYKDFFFHLAHNVSSLDEDWVRLNLERELEKQVMGQPDYDSAKRGKYYNKKEFNESIMPKVWLASRDENYDYDAPYYRP